MATIRLGNTTPRKRIRVPVPPGITSVEDLRAHAAQRGVDVKWLEGRDDEAACIRDHCESTLGDDPGFVPDPDIQYVTTINVSPHSDLMQAVRECITCWEEAAHGKPAWVEAECCADDKCTAMLGVVLAAHFGLEVRA